MNIQSCIKRLESLTDHIERLGGHIEGTPYAEDVEALKEATSLLVEKDIMPIFTDINTAVSEVMKIALEKTQTTKADVFVHLNAHVDSMDVIVFKNGWTEDFKYDFKVGTYLKPTELHPEEDIVEGLKELYHRISNIDIE